MNEERPVGYRYNSPPGWPPPPEGWSPPPGWQPDPSWPPAPEGWEFWLPDPGATEAGAASGAAGAPGAGAAPEETSQPGAPEPHAGSDAPTQAFGDQGSTTQAFGTGSGAGAGVPPYSGQPDYGGQQHVPGQQPPAGAAGAGAGATASYQYQPSGHLDQPGESPYDTGFLRSGQPSHGQGQPDYQQGGYPGAQGGYPGGPQGGYPGGAAPGQGAPGEGRKSNTGILIAAIVVGVLVLGLLIWGGIALFGGDDDPEEIPTTSAPDPTEEPTEDPDETEEPTDDPTDDPTDEPTDEPTDDPTDDNGPVGPDDGEAVVLELGEAAVIQGTESDPEVTLAVLSVEEWEAESGAFFCTEPELDGYIEFAVEVTTYDLDEPYDFSPINFGIADSDQNTMDEVNPFMGLLCDNPDMIESEMSANETYTGTVILDVPSDGSYIVWEELFDFTGEAVPYLWGY
ncbi:hypothetical protein [Sanguibacter sp. Z1732]|uniref:hypothetical protein n=1 Tax=Sanguibacter sp. Z1732 TaxID=3435412 RepID=UPI003D9CBD3E